MTDPMNRVHRLIEAVQLGIMMLRIEARAHRENQEPKKAEAVEGAIATMEKALGEEWKI